MLKTLVCSHQLSYQSTQDKKTTNPFFLELIHLSWNQCNKYVSITSLCKRWLCKTLWIKLSKSSCFQIILIPLLLMVQSDSETPICAPLDGWYLLLNCLLALSQMRYFKFKKFNVLLKNHNLFNHKHKYCCSVWLHRSNLWCNECYEFVH